MLRHALQRPPARVSTPSSWLVYRSASSAARRGSVSTAPLPPAERKTRSRYEELAELRPAAHRLAFRSIPYGSPPNVIFPPSNIPQFSTSNRFFTLRCFPSQSRHLGNGMNPHPPAVSSKKSLPTPPPSLLLAMTDPDPLRPNPFLSSREEIQQRAHRLARGRKPYTVDLTIFASKKKVHKNAVVRERCKRRCREAIRLVVVRNAKVPAATGDKEELVLREEDLRETGPRKWLLPGYHYIMNITLETYRGPLPELVTSVREALKTLKVKAEAVALAAHLAEIEIAPRTRLPDAFPIEANAAPPPK
ncbi:hypothetical protein JCM10908_002821 [Rhodotorula pacifica]|uniref:uncharacterized protein n=1 Tax=Rhodotorula pacifica TaxID=1495444 RepID=UPI00317BC0AD